MTARAFLVFLLLFAPLLVVGYYFGELTAHNGDLAGLASAMVVLSFLSGAVLVMGLRRR